MANNRMVLVCRLCKKGISIAKYYPMITQEAYEEYKKQYPKDFYFGIGGVDGPENSGWYVPSDNLYDRMNEFFIRHKHNCDFSTFGKSQYYLGYESDKKTWEYEKL